MPVDPKKYYLFLDGFRGIAVFWIILHHVFVFFDPKTVLGPLFAPLSKFAAVGVFGVDMFFVISGFLITGLLLEDLNKGKIRFKRFYSRRFLKIIPQYVLIVILGLILMLVYSPGVFGVSEQYHPLEHIWIYFVFIQNYFTSQLPALAHLWTLAVEEQFYAVYPLLLLGVSLLLKDPHEKRVLLITICLLLMIMGNLSRYDQLAEILRSHKTFFFFQETHFHFDGLVFGILIKLIEPYLSGMIGIARKILSWGCLISSLGIYYIFIQKGIDVMFWPTLGLAYLAPGLLLISALTDDLGLVQHTTGNQAFRWVGRSSYAIYLWHYILIFLFLENFKKPVVLNVILAYIAITVFVGFLSTVTIERYFLNFRRLLDNEKMV